MEITIRDAVLSDAPGLARVVIETTAHAFRGLVPEKCLSDLTPDESLVNWQTTLCGGLDANEFVLVAADPTGQVVGYLMAWQGAEDPVHGGEIGALYILPAHQRRGIGRLLLRRAAERLMDAGVRSVRLGCLSINPSCAFYERLGGKRVGERERPWAGNTFQEIIYGWQDISHLTTIGQHVKSNPHCDRK